jgi:hypothetical protein
MLLHLTKVNICRVKFLTISVLKDKAAAGNSISSWFFEKVDRSIFSFFLEDKDILFLLFSASFLQVR